MKPQTSEIWYRKALLKVPNVPFTNLLIDCHNQKVKSISLKESWNQNLSAKVPEY